MRSRHSRLRQCYYWRSPGAADYIAIAAAFHTVFIFGIPQLDHESLPQARRLITLIDALYDARIKLVAVAAEPPVGLFDSSGVGQKDEAFAFDRTVRTGAQ